MPLSTYGQHTAIQGSTRQNKDKFVKSISQYSWNISNNGRKMANGLGAATNVVTLP